MFETHAQSGVGGLKYGLMILPTLNGNLEVTWWREHNCCLFLLGGITVTSSWRTVDWVVVNWSTSMTSFLLNRCPPCLWILHAQTELAMDWTFKKVCFVAGRFLVLITWTAQRHTCLQCSHWLGTDIRCLCAQVRIEHSCRLMERVQYPRTWSSEVILEPATWSDVTLPSSP